MNEISRWQEAFSTLPDKQFFNTMRLYLGEIKTPYNKQRLIEQLAGFIRREENANAIITLLDEFDVKVLTAISLIPNATKDILTDFFSGTYTFSEIYSEIVNLKERLIIFAETDNYTGTEKLLLNPLLAEKIKPYLNINLILPDASVVYYSMEDAFAVTPNFLSAFISYLRVRGINCKADGIIKKNDLNRLEEIFPGRAACVQLLMNAFVNLSLVREGDKAFMPDIGRLESFAELSQEQQIALLCAASVSRFSRDGLKKEAQLLLDCLSSIPQTGYTRQTILRLAFLVGTHTEDGSAIAKKSRFSQMLDAAHGGAASDPQQNADLLDRMIDSAIEFGLIQELGKDEEQNPVYINPTIQSIPLPNSQSTPKVLNIDSTFTVTLMPGLPLKSLLPLTSFLMIKKCAVVTEFEIGNDFFYETLNNKDYYICDVYNLSELARQMVFFTNSTSVCPAEFEKPGAQHKIQSILNPRIQGYNGCHVIGKQSIGRTALKYRFKLVVGDKEYWSNVIRIIYTYHASPPYATFGIRID